MRDLIELGDGHAKRASASAAWCGWRSRLFIVALGLTVFRADVKHEPSAIADFREDYRRGALDRAGLDANPIAQFESWFRDATGEQSQSRWRKIGIALYKLWSAILNHRPADINAMTLATVDKSGKPSTRTVLLKGGGRARLHFFHELRQPQRPGTGGKSQRGADVFLAGFGAAGLRGRHGRQNCRRRNRRRISRAVRAAAGWRPGRRTRANVVADRAALEAKWRELEKKFPGDIPLPPNWGGLS